MGPITETIKDLVQECYANQTLKETDRLEILEMVMINMANMMEADHKRVVNAMLGDYIKFARMKRKRKIKP